MTKIPISKDKSGREAVNSSENGTFGDIKKPTDLRGMKFGSRNSFNFKKFLLITVLILGTIFIISKFATWYRDSKMITPIEIKNQVEEPSQPIEPEIIEATSTPEEIIEEVEKVTISETETGWLNVREGAGTSYEIIKKVYPGESYVLLEEVEEWMKIQISDPVEENGASVQTGWIFSEYAVKQ